jgi:hypothetical protein
MVAMRGPFGSRSAASLVALLISLSGCASQTAESGAEDAGAAGPPMADSSTGHASPADGARPRRDGTDARVGRDGADGRDATDETDSDVNTGVDSQADAPGPDASTAFVSVSGTHFALGAKRFYFGGANSYYLGWADPYELDSTLAAAAALSFKVLRVFPTVVVGTYPFTGSDTVWASSTGFNGWAPSTATNGGTHGVYFQSWDPDAGTMQINNGATGLDHVDAMLVAATSYGIRLVLGADTTLHPCSGLNWADSSA